MNCKFCNKQLESHPTYKWFTNVICYSCGFAKHPHIKNIDSLQEFKSSAIRNIRAYILK